MPHLPRNRRIRGQSLLDLPGIRQGHHQATVPRMRRDDSRTSRNNVRLLR